MYIRVKASAGAKRETVTEVSEALFEISVREKPERNMANARILELLRARFPGKKVRIIKGHHSPSKIVSVE